MSTLGPKQALFAQFATIAKTLGHAHRLELLEQLAQGERSVEVLADQLLHISNDEPAGRADAEVLVLEAKVGLQIWTRRRTCPQMAASTHHGMLLALLGLL